MTVENIMCGIQKLELLDPNSLIAYDEAISAYRSMENIPFFMLDMPPKLALFHSRTHEKDNFFKDFKEIEIPEPQHIKSFARCNCKGQPIFYCSEDRITSYSELIRNWAENENTNDVVYVTISKWRTVYPLCVMIVTSPKEIDRISYYDKQQGPALDKFISEQNDKETQQAMKIFYNYLFDRFRKPAKNDLKNYIITAAYCDLSFGNNQNIDAIYYPSVPYDGQGVNFAFHEDYDFKNKMILEIVARDTFKILNTTPLPTFRQSNFKQAISLDTINRKIIWD